jgi:hypothetical protein
MTSSAGHGGRRGDTPDKENSMGTRFFKIVGVVSYGLAAVALISTVILGLAAANGYFGGADESISTPELTINDYRTHVAPKEEPESTETTDADDTTAPETDPDTEEVDRLIKEFVKLIWQYNEVTGQGDPNPEGIKQWIYQVTDDMRDDQARARYLRRLNETVEEDLVEPAKDGDGEILTQNIPGLDEENGTYINWDQYLEWFTFTYMDAYYEELRRIEEERQQHLKEKQEAIITAGVAATAFVLFILATLVLVLVRIEHNTRPTST